MVTSYSRETIITRLNKHFSAQGFECTEYSSKLGEVRLPLYCVRKHGDKIEEEIVIDIITELTVSEDLYLPTITVDSATIRNACSPTFFQFYLPHARVFWAYGCYVLQDDNYASFRQACVQNGIGLLKVSDAEVVVVESAHSLLDVYKAEIKESIRKASNEDEIISATNQTVERLSEDYIHRLVYYGDSVFRRREIIGRGTQDLSLLLLDRLQGISNIQYRGELIQLANGYRKETREDYQIALDTVKSLWQSRFQTDYPDVQRDFEPILQLDPKYRDHFLHTFQVFLLGALMIDELYHTTPIQAFGESSGSLVEDAWLAASTYHDFHYPVQECEAWMKKFFKQYLNLENGVPISLNLEGVVVRDDFLSKMQEICAIINYEMDDCILRFVFEKTAVERDHAALATLSFLNKFEDNSKLAGAAKSQAALSILLHAEGNWKSFCGREDCEHSWEVALSNKRIITNLRFDTLPLAFLLAYCDVAQEWGRVGRNYELSRPELVGLTIDGTKILIHILVENDSSFGEKQEEIQRLKRFLRDDRFGLKIESRTGMSTEIWMTGT